MTPSWNAWRLFRRAQTFQSLGAPGKAAALYRQALAFDPGDACALLWLGLAESERGRFVEARASIEQAAGLQPQSGAARLFLARVAYDQRRPDEARTCLIALLDKCENPHARALLALCALDAGDLEEFRRHMPRRIPFVPWLMARFLLAIEARAGAAQQEQRTVLEIRQAIARGAASPENHYALGLAALRCGRLTLARRAFQACVDPEFIGERLAEISITGAGNPGV